ncbi:Replication factor A protein 3 [Cercospora beticola]|uniref:Replication factor A protein 3 n=2 Tax=Cercospora TaxID=29002 RepID=A0A2G5I5U5_CERBT|nr:Replication factor A protein 3 [Cercospora beticola]XP_044660619.1 uncharacterized protein CKM354_000927100 [Cercospora kikuchii]PIB00177.1 Replication factor A protein 3 [Cercospora beticola]WPB00226.1 hypothetical protein RHO25_004845 [Cercospora beticola]CAK1361580.1 unnamed protein product [Cercospora beticola]GIZ46132.1 hypothetical protein CKM354_000927100 [Cercospora kikuchii]
MSEATPRITAPYLEQFSHRTVRILGKVRQIRGEMATIEAGGKIDLHLNKDCHLQNNHAFEFIGKVQQDLSVRVLASTDLGPEGSIDFNAIDAVVDATHRYHEIFYAKDE